MSLIYMGLSWGLVVVGYLATTLVLANQENERRHEVAEASKLNRQLQQQISERKTQDQLINLMPIEVELKDLRLQQQRQQLLIKFLAESDMTDQARFSEAMAGLARQHVPGIAIEWFALIAFNNSLSIQGQLARPEALPAYLKRLGEEPVFEAVQFNKVVMTTTDEQLSFETSSIVPLGQDS